MRVRVIGMFLLMYWCVLGFATTLNTIKFNQNGTLVTFGLSNQTNYRIFTLTNPYRVVVDLPQTSTRLTPNLHVNNGMVTSMRLGHPQPSTLRLVFDVKQSTKPSATWHAARLVIALQSGSQPTQRRVETNPRSPSPIHYHHSPSRLRDVVVVIDPGHGGKDPGATGPKHSVEKNVVLAISQKLKKMIDGQPGMRAVLTRQGDYYIGLRERLDIARKYNADIFIAIHADAFINQQSNGASVFALSQRGATSEAARWLAEKENYSELGGVNLSQLDDENGMIRTVLLDLSQTATINAGLQMGGYILQYLAKITTLHNTKVEQARFVVLKSPDIPSVLVETGFISNPNEERNLTNPAYQTRLSQALFEGIKRYFYEHPIQGTRLEAMTAGHSQIARSATRTSWFSAVKRRV